jgi:opacity protein-like surface antigen
MRPLRPSFRIALPVALAAAALAFPDRARAQSGPPRGSVSVFAGLGLTVPAESRVSSTLGIAGGIDYAVTSSLSVGALVGGWKGDTDLDADDSELYFDAVGSYAWNLRRIRPFVQAGLGAYRVDPPDAGAETNFGGFIGGGVNYALRGALSVEGTARYHFAPDVAEFQGRFLEVLAGVRLTF